MSVCLSRSDPDHLHHLRAITQKLEFTVFLLCIVKLFCWFWFRFFRWLQMIEKIEDWFVIIGFIWKICIICIIIQKLEFSVVVLCIINLFCWFLFRFVEMIADDWKDWRLICDNRLYLKDLYHLVPSASSTCDHPKVGVFSFLIMYFKTVLFRFVKKIADHWKDWRLICDDRIIWKIYHIICIIHVRSSKVEVFYVFSVYFEAVLLVVEMIGKIEEINFAIRLHLKRFSIIFVFIFFIYAKVPKGPPCFAGVI